jgi:hypothetical protein
MSVTMPLLTEGIHCCAAGVGAVNQSVGGHDIDRDVHPPQCVSGTHTARTMDRYESSILDLSMKFLLNLGLFVTSIIS